MLKFLDEFISILEKHDLPTVWVSFAIALSIIVLPLMTLLINFMKWKGDRNKFNLEKYLSERENNRLLIEDINKKLTDFFLPLRYFLLQSKMLYDTFALDEKAKLELEGKNFNTLRHLCDGENFSEKDRLILEQIISIGDKQNNIIEEKNWTAENNSLSTLLSKYSAHLKILKLAFESELFREQDIYKGYVFPIELPGAIESQILDLMDKKESLIDGYKSDRVYRSIKKYSKDAYDYYASTISLAPGEDLVEFKAVIKSGGVVCDIGCGSGRDSIYLIKNGFRVFSTEPSKDLANLARNYPYIFVKEESILDMNYSSQFDAVWCSAVLQHIPKEELENVIQRISRMLNRKGYVYISYRITATLIEKVIGSVNIHDQKIVTDLLEKFNFEILSRKESVSSLDGVNRFVSYMAKKRG